MSQKEYREAPGISRSELFRISRSPLHFKYAMEHPEDSASLAFGRALHKYILEKEDFYNDFVLLPEINRRTKVGREAYAHFRAKASEEGKEIVTRDDMAVIEDMRDELMKHPLAVALLSGEHERDFFWTDAFTGEACKCRPDCITEYEGKRYIVDYKSTESCEDGCFERSCRRYGYKFQAGMYTEGVFQNTFSEHGFVFIAQEKKPPYAVRVYFCTPEFVAQGYDQFRELIGIYHACRETGNWYGYEGPLDMPAELMEEDV